MKTHSQFRLRRLPMLGQRGVVLFFALIALLAMSLAAVALIRSVDTSTIIAGNLAFKQSTTKAGDSGIEAASIRMSQMQAISKALNVLNDPTHPFNVTCLATRAAGTLGPTDPGCATIVRGYHSSIDPALNLLDPATWDGINSVKLPEDSNGNTTSYIIQRICRNANQPVATAGCLFVGTPQEKDDQRVKPPQEVCDGDGCPPVGQVPQNRITTRTTGPRETVSYVQAFVY